MRSLMLVSVATHVVAAVIIILNVRRITHTALLAITLIFSFAGIVSVLEHSIELLPARGSEIFSFILSIVILLSVFIITQISKKSQQTIQHLKSLHEIERSMLSGLSHRGIINTIINKLNEILQNDAAAILLTTKDKSEVKSIIAQNLTENLEEYLKTKGNGFVTTIMGSRKPFTIPRISDTEQLELLNVVRGNGFQSFLALPIILKGGMPIGILTLYSRRTRRFSKNEITLIHAVNSQIGLALDREHLIERIQDMNVESVRALVEAIESRDPCTRGHSMQVADLAVLIAKELEFTQREIILMEFAGLLHDVGKIAVPELILQKAGTLSKDEWIIIKKHSVSSAKILEPISSLRSVQSWVLYHHERWDGSGYPEGRKEQDIPLHARILSVCDTFSAMTSDRPYRRARSVEEALMEIETVSGSQLDPHIADLFVKLYKKNRIDNSDLEREKGM